MPTSGSSSPTRLAECTSWDGDGSATDAARRLATSWLLPPVVFAGLRLLLGVFCLCAMITSWVDTGINSRGNDEYSAAMVALLNIAKTFAFFTWLTYWGLTTHLISSGIRGFVYASTGETGGKGWWLLARRLLYSSVTTFPFLVTLVFWSVLFKGNWPDKPAKSFVNMSQHILNSVFALSEIVLSANQPPPWLHLPMLIGVLALYLGMVYLMHALYGFYSYGFVNPDQIGVWGVVQSACGIALSYAVFFCIVRLAVALRQMWTGPPVMSPRDAAASKMADDGLSDVEMQGLLVEDEMP